MAAPTVTAPLEPEELDYLDSYAPESGRDRDAIVKSALTRGLKAIRMEQAVEAYRNGEATMSKACLIAGISMWEWFDRMEEFDLTLNYGIEEYREDMKNLRSL